MIRQGTERLLTAATTSAAAIAVAVLAGEPEALILAAPWTVMLALGLARSQRGPRDIRVETNEDRFLVGDEVELAITIDGMTGFVHIACTPDQAFWPETADEDMLVDAQVHDVLLPGSSLLVALDAEQWGVHDVGHVEVTVTEPYGLFRWSGTAGEPRFVRVHPTQTQVRNLLAPWLVRRVTGTHNSRALGRGVEYADIRLFASGDSLREINWKASARSTELWVSQRHPDRATDVVLLVDSFVESGHDVRTVFGLAIEGAVALAESHLAVADRVGLVELGGTVRWVSPGAGSHQLQRISDALLSTGLHSHVADRDLTGLLSRALPPRSFVVALTPLLDDRFIEGLFILAGHGHDVGVVECIPPMPAVDVTSEPAWLLWQAERQMIRDRLAESGVAVATWREGDHLDLALLDLARRRRRTLQGRQR